MHSFELILTLTGGLVAALICGYVTQQLKMSPLVGYLFAGIIVGPFTPGFVADRHLAEQLAEIGVILLMFGVGLQLHVEDLLAVRKVAVPGAVVQSLVATAIGAWLALDALAPGHDVVIAGIDGNPQAVELIGDCTAIAGSVRQDFAAMSVAAADALAAILSGGAGEPQEVTVPSVLVTRDSLGASC